MTRMKGIGLAVVIAACSGKAGPGPGGGTALGGSGSGSGGSDGLAPIADGPLPAATPRPPPSKDPVVTDRAPDGWWQKGAAGCPGGGQIDGAPPPKGDHVRCTDKQGMSEGPEAYWGSDGKLLSSGWNHEGKRHGVWTSYYPDGSKMNEGSHLRGERHGVWTEWHPNGKVSYTGTYVDGRADGDHVYYTADGKEAGRVTMKMGTGTWITWNADGTKHESYGYVDGVAHGPYTAWYPSGKVSATGRFVDGNADGTDVEYDEQGHKRHEQHYLRGSLDGPETRWDEQGRILKVIVYDHYDQVSVRLYQDGKPLATWKASACDTKDGLARAVGKDSDHCVERAAHFPGLVLLGSFAYDRGCMPAGYVLDCKPKQGGPDAHDALARAGWQAAGPDAKKELAEALISEVLHRFDGSVSSEPAPEKIDLAGDGSAVVTFWLQDPSGMTRGWTRHLMETHISADGHVSEKELRSESGGEE